MLDPNPDNALDIKAELELVVAAAVVAAVAVVVADAAVEEVVADAKGDKRKMKMGKLTLKVYCVCSIKGGVERVVIILCKYYSQYII